MNEETEANRDWTHDEMARILFELKKRGLSVEEATWLASAALEVASQGMCEHYAEEPFGEGLLQGNS